MRVPKKGAHFKLAILGRKRPPIKKSNNKSSYKVLILMSSLGQSDNCS